MPACVDSHNITDILKRIFWYEINRFHEQRFQKIKRYFKILKTKDYKNSITERSVQCLTLAVLLRHWL